MRRLILLGLLVLLLPGRAIASDTILWLSIGTGLSWYNEIDPDELEELATAGSIRARTPSSSRQITFDDKGFEVPALIQVGIRLTPDVNVWGMYQRLPYQLEGPEPGPEADGTINDPPQDSVFLRAPANVFGGGMDFRLGREGYLESMILSVGIGALSFDGEDEDTIGYPNIAITGNGILYEGSLMFEIDFARDLKFYPFVSFRYADISNTTAEYVSVRNPTVNPTLPEYSIEYTGVTIGVTARFKVWPFDPVDDEPSIFDP